MVANLSAVKIRGLGGVKHISNTPYIHAKRFYNAQHKTTSPIYIHPIASIPYKTITHSNTLFEHAVRFRTLCPLSYTLFVSEHFRKFCSVSRYPIRASFS